MHGHSHHLHSHARAHAFSRGGSSCCCGEPTPHHGDGCSDSGTTGHHESGCCDVGSRVGFHRRFTGRDEVFARLEAYLAELRAEAKAVEEHIAEFKKAH